MDMKTHWETVYATKQPNEVSWTQERPQTSLDLINGLNLPESAAIIDIGGGDSKLVDCLLEAGYEDITVLDISANAIKRAQQRLGKDAEKVTWIVCDINEFKPTKTYDVWHDRAAFHFLTTPENIAAYIALTSKWVNEQLIIGTFSTEGPKKCSGLDITQYSKEELQHLFAANFTPQECFTINHTTPFNTVQNFVFCSFKHKAV
ncbi:MAG: class I SAM-dependent methyltransferase [Bacteroidetes bacterium]|nr:MAG: class I SAM-dependent methyltransferase [Bacteroidota bacterium]